MAVNLLASIERIRSAVVSGLSNEEIALLLYQECRIYHKPWDKCPRLHANRFVAERYGAVVNIYDADLVITAPTYVPA